MKISDKISIRCSSEDEAVKEVIDILSNDNKFNINIDRISLRFDGCSQVYDIYYSYDEYDKGINGYYEIERKFLVGDIDLNGYDYKIINQSYIGFNPVSRVRCYDGMYYYTEKSVGTLVREEKEYEISKELYDKFINYRIGREINKIRYRVPLSEGDIAEVDVYLGELSGIKVVEVEFNNLSSAKLFNIPSWFGVEVTDDKRYKNDSLAILTDEEIKCLVDNNCKIKGLI